MPWGEPVPSFGAMTDPEHIEDQDQLAGNHAERADDGDGPLLRERHFGRARAAVGPTVDPQLHQFVLTLERPFVHPRRILQHHRRPFRALEEGDGGAGEVAERVGVIRGLHRDPQVVGFEGDHRTAGGGEGKAERKSHAGGGPEEGGLA